MIEHEPESEVIGRAERARQITEDPLFIEAWQGLEQGAISRLASADTNDPKLLQALTQSLQTIRSVRGVFEVWMAEGRDAAERRARREEAERKPGLMHRFRRAA